MRITRRELLEKLFAMYAGLLGLSFFLSLKTKPGAPKHVLPPGEGPVKVATLEELKARGYVKFLLRRKPALLLLVDNNIKAYSAECPHMGCPVSASSVKEKGYLECPCHGSTFSPETGERLSGPAPGGLEELEIEVKDNEIYI